ncbi:Autophagy-related protein 3 [Macleaya cordata]|uniref:Ubiquitin-like-conjugating enzyme ATG10 n=1 Tax=Macleaya cordata TaxID=56857 RepID=A0A200PM72_MACCD|nr:Autophagy-related protein 3 [Macleaya cordata]
MDICSSWDGTLSSSDFRVAATTLSKKWKVINPVFPPWTWVPCPRRPFWVASSDSEVDGYLSLENFYQLSSNEVGHRCSIETQALNNLVDVLCSYKSSPAKEELVNCGKEEPVDNATLVQSDDQEMHFYDFHIVYSNSYRVPVLYFRGYQSDGQLLALDEIERDLPLNSLKILRESKWTFMTQEEHPYLNRPWYTLHPCGTSEWMKLLFLGGDSQTKDGPTIQQQYLVSWLSVVGQAVGLRIPLEMINNSCPLYPVNSVTLSNEVND